MKRALLFVITLLWNDAFGQSGALDPTFGQGGKVVTDVDQVRNATNKILIQPDGKVVLIGYCVPSYQQGYFTLIRYNVDGSLDQSFGQNGIVKTIVGPEEDIPFSGALQPDGKILAAGYSWNGLSYDFAMVRYTTNGARDLTFGVSGIVSTDFGDEFSEVANIILLQPDGKIILAGYSQDAVNNDLNMAMARYNANGSLDDSFGIEGKVIVEIGEAGLVQSIRSIALQSDGKIVGAGYTEQINAAQDEISNVVALIRLTQNGLLDNSFGNGGIVQTAIGKNDVAAAIAVQPNNRILVLGKTKAVKYGYTDFLLLRYKSDGQLDPVFGQDGIVITSFDNTDDEGSALILQPDSKILAAGFTAKNNGSTVDFALCRYNSNGSLDLGFGDSGKISTDFIGSLDFGSCIALQQNARIIVGGYARKGTDYDFALARYQNDAALPVKLISFQAEKLEKSVRLKWETNGEFNSDLFVIQRSSSGKEWEVIGTRDAAAISDTIRSYEFIDTVSIAGEVLYRLKMIDLDQTYCYSLIKMVKFEKLMNESLLLVYPNPVSDILKVSLPDAEGFQKMELINVKGEVVSNWPYPQDQLDISKFSSGTYFLRIVYCDQSVTRKLVIND
ncbi:T9SS type A sorting domain-containing protein [Dyadobacter arcticus]|uniref:Delta-60 repeat protein n=1 Tax=Dyadobacter arcticus TaxID=1078754 RepID=A0ABX0URN1_9BACT|nr:T9SS type A sorting domain-containing protein [Dyadobacter arcticus]NIJ54310.1 putative delta-60 repeat protein [Dyadobacter arcticus]